jgi:DNA helicase-2/ATP-dependent DNA helicase PcrA
VYSFRGATVENILNFPEQYPGTTRVTLEQNYRSTMPILRTANAVMQRARRSYTKNLWSDRPGEQKPFLVTCSDEVAQATFIAKRILEHREEGIPFTKQAVLFRAGHNSAALEIELSRHDVPFVKWGGRKFLEAAHVKDLLAFLRVLENPRDDLSWMRILQMLEGIGPGRAREAVRLLEQNAGDIHALVVWNAPAALREPLGRLIKLIAELSQPAIESCLSMQIPRILKFYTPLLEELHDNPEMRLRDLEQLEALAQQAQSRSSFLADLTLDPPSSTSALADSSRKDEEYVTLSTIHSAKGGEWDVVYIIQAVDGVIPSDRAQSEAEIEEERRLLYVGLTRARHRLFVTFPLRSFHQRQGLGDAHRTVQLTRFLPPAVWHLFERASFCPAVPAIPKVKISYGLSANVQNRVRRLWT